jgi:hypothetical protein
MIDFKTLPISKELQKSIFYIVVDNILYANTAFKARLKDLKCYTIDDLEKMKLKEDFKNEGD